MAGQAADEERIFPLREEIARIIEQSGGRNDGAPPEFRRLEAIMRAVVGDRLAIIMGAVLSLWIAIVE